MGVSARRRARSAMLAACDEHELPLFTVPYEIPFIAVTRRSPTTPSRSTTRRCAAPSTCTARSSATSWPRGIPGVLATVGRAMPGRRWSRSTSRGELGRIDPDGLGDGLDLGPRLWARAPRPGARPARAPVDGRAVTSASRAARRPRSRRGRGQRRTAARARGAAVRAGRRRRQPRARPAPVGPRGHPRPGRRAARGGRGGRTTSASIERALSARGHPGRGLPGPGRRAGRRVTTTRCARWSRTRCCRSAAARRPLDGIVTPWSPTTTTAAERVAAAAERRGWPELRSAGAGRRPSSTPPAAMREAHVALNLEDRRRPRRRRARPARAARRDPGRPRRRGLRRPGARAGLDHDAASRPPGRHAARLPRPRLPARTGRRRAVHPPPHAGLPARPDPRPHRPRPPLGRAPGGVRAGARAAGADHRSGERRRAGISFWLETADDDPTPAPRWTATEVDVAVVGAGFTGLWTARELLRARPVALGRWCRGQTPGSARPGATAPG
jgi:hypothetical protein